MRFLHCECNCFFTVGTYWLSWNAGVVAVGPGQTPTDGLPSVRLAGQAYPINYVSFADGYGPITYVVATGTLPYPVFFA